MTPGPQRVGLLGGTFDPVHNAHLELARLFAQRLALDQVRFVPAGIPWQKSTVGASPAQRLAMLRLALAQSHLDATIDERELNRDGPSFTVDTLTELRAETGVNSMLVLLLGADQLLRLHTWSRWPKLFDLANLAVGGRPSYGLDLDSLDSAVALQVRQRQVETRNLPGSLFASAGQVALVPADLGDISSSAVRQYLADGNLEGVRDLVPSTVMEYIGESHLYTI